MSKWTLRSAFRIKEMTEAIIGAAFEVHQQLGYGFLERVYQRALQVELVRRGTPPRSRSGLTVRYKDVIVGDYDADLLVDGRCCRRDQGRAAV